MKTQDLGFLSISIYIHGIKEIINGQVSRHPCWPTILKLLKVSSKSCQILTPTTIESGVLLNMMIVRIVEEEYLHRRRPLLVTIPSLRRIVPLCCSKKQKCQRSKSRPSHQSGPQKCPCFSARSPQMRRMKPFNCASILALFMRWPLLLLLCVLVMVYCH